MRAFSDGHRHDRRGRREDAGRCRAPGSGGLATANGAGAVPAPGPTAG
ncbi:hypothetical protein K701_10580 [Streptomyces fradiae ATCC 10745 = DSM 40063]|uniref:Uncharacterized protein n=1 Tax=Streptomyces fradiae ATCC 10745 = DSM 40063 TaxID=1319510 RepID=A0ABQ6XVX4_STRFR|nr:hypothetical protein K701_10580 [Streptomyces fradiae ATCC 10745 = DSM 40063]